MDDLLIYIIALFCGDGAGRPPDPVLLALFRGAGQVGVSCVDPDERTQAAYPRLVLSGAEGEQNQTGDGQADIFDGDVRLEIVTRQSDAVPDEIDLLALLKARCTDLLLGNPRPGLPPLPALPPLQGRVVTVGGNSYNVAAFRQVRPTGRLPAEDPTIKRWGGVYRVKLCRLGF